MLFLPKLLGPRLNLKLKEEIGLFLWNLFFIAYNTEQVDKCVIDITNNHITFPLKTIRDQFSFFREKHGVFGNARMRCNQLL